MYSLAVTLVAGYLVYILLIYPNYLDPIRNLPGPPPEHILLGNLEEILQAHRLDDLVAKQGA